MALFSGSGSFRVGGSLSSSTLSALAPPFMSDKSFSKPNSTEPLFDIPAYGTVFDPAGAFWNPSSSSSATGPNLLATETMGTNTTCPASPGIYGYPGCQSSNSCSMVYHVTSNPRTAYDPFPYEQFPNSVPESADEVPKPYYPSYVSSPTRKDGYLGMGVVARPGYDLSSNSGNTSLSGCGPSLVHHTTGFSSGGRDSESKWGDFWTGVNDGENCDWKGYGQGFGSKDLDLPGLSSRKIHVPGDVSNNNHPFVNWSSQVLPFGEISDEGFLKQGASPTWGLNGQRNLPSVSDRSFDLFNGANRFGSFDVCQQDYNSSFDLNLGGTSSDCSKIPTFFSPPSSDRSPHLQEAVPESVTSFCGAQEAGCSTLEEQVSQTGSFVFNCTSPISTFPITTSNMSYQGSNFSAPTTVSATRVSPAWSDAVNKNFVSTWCDSSCPKERQIPPGLRCRSSIIIQKPVSSFITTSSSQVGETVKRHDEKDASDNSKSTLQVPIQFSSNGFGLETGDADVISVEKHSGGSDAHNPGEDSPCWKGASSTRVSPFGVSEAVVPDAPLKYLDGRNCLSTQEASSMSFLVDTFHSIDVSTEKVYENSLKRPFISDFPAKDHENFGSMGLKSHSFDLNTGAELHSVDNYHEVSESLNMPNDAKTISNSLFASQLITRSGEAYSAGKILSEAAAAEKNGNCFPIATPDFSGGVSSSVEKEFCSTPDGTEPWVKCYQSPLKVSDTKIDTNVLLKAMINLSEVLRYCCFSNPAAVMQHQSETIKQIIDNLNASMMMTNGPTSSSLMLSSQAISLQKELSGAEMRTKNIMLENIEEEMDQHNCLYKNLWLEAEAALCAMTAKARVHHRKIEMEKTCNSTEGKEKPPSPSIPSVVNISVACPGTSATRQCEVSTINKLHKPNSQEILSSQEYEGPPSTKKGVCFPSLPSTNPCASGNGSGSDGPVNDIESSITTGYQILKDRIDLSDSLNYASEHFPGEDNRLLDKVPSNQETFDIDSYASRPDDHANDIEIETSAVLSRYQILRCHADSSGSLNSELSGERNYLRDDTFSNPDKPLQNSQLFNSVGVSEDSEASVMERSHILPNQINCLDTVDKDFKLGQASRPLVNDLAQGLGWSKEVDKTIFGLYPGFAEDEDANKFGTCLNGAASIQSCKSNCFKSIDFEGWYDDCSSSDWEHVSKEDLQRQN